MEWEWGRGPAATTQIDGRRGGVGVGVVGGIGVNRTVTMAKGGGLKTKVGEVWHGGRGEFDMNVEHSWVWTF